MSWGAGVSGGHRLRLSEEAVAWRLVGDEVVALDLGRSTYLGVNRTGAVIWPALAEGATRDELLDLLTARFDVDRAVAAGDLDAFLVSLERRGLVQWVPEP